MAIEPFLERPIRRVAPPGAPAVGGVDSHGSAVAGAGSTAAGDTTIGTVTLPADGPWNIWGIWCMIAQQTATPGESFGGHFRLNSLDGDVEPNPAPTRFPTGIGGSFLGATQMARICPLRVWPVSFNAPGKARIELIYNEPTAVSVATQVVMGLMYGKQPPVSAPFLYVDRVRIAQTAAADTLVGTVTLAEKARRISYVGGVMAADNVIVAGEELLGFFRLSSDDINLPPSQWPFNAAYGAGLGAVIEQPRIEAPFMIPVNIPTPGGARVDCYVDLNTAVTNAAEVEIFLAYE